MLSQLVEQIYTTERISAFGYSISNELHPDRYPYMEYEPIENIKDIKKTLEYGFGETDKLGDMEALLISMLYPVAKNTCNAVVGARSSGKTATMRFLKNYIEKNYKFEKGNKPLVILIDCNDCLDEIKEKGITNQIDFLLKWIAKKVIYLLTNDYFDEYSELVFKIRDGKKKAKSELIDQFIARYSAKLLKNITKANLKDFAYTFCDDLDSEILSFQFALDLVGEIYKIIDNKFAFVCFDNLDPFHALTQRELLNKSVRVINKYELPLVIPVRVITFEQDPFKALTIRTIIYNGVEPYNEVVFRTRRAIENILKCKDKELINEFDAVNYRTKIAYLIKVAEIFHQLMNDNTLKELFITVAGNSVGRGLSFFQRCFKESDNVLSIADEIMQNDYKKIEELISEMPDCNFIKFLESVYNEIVIKIYERNNKYLPKEYHYLQLAIHYCDRKVGNYGPIIEKLFKYDGKFTDLKWRILNWLELKLHERNETVKIETIYDYARKLGYKIEELCICIDSMQQVDKRLIWTDGEVEYKNSDNLWSRRSDEVGISYSGRLYLKNLAHSIDYLGYTLAMGDKAYFNITTHSLIERTEYITRLIYENLSEQIKRYDKHRKIISLELTNKQQDELDEEFFALFNMFSHVLSSIINIIKLHFDNIRTNKDDSFEKKKELIKRQIEFLKTMFDAHFGLCSNINLLGYQDYCKDILGLKWEDIIEYKIG
jgi:hypothetical protein